MSNLCKYQKISRLVSYDLGQSWQPTGEYRKGDLIEYESADCPIQYKLQATYSDSTSYSVECDSATTLTTGDTNPSGYEYSAMTSAIIGNCITSIGDAAFMGCDNLSSIVIPDSVVTIGSQAFYVCNSLSSVTIPNSVISVGNGTFYGCNNLDNVTIGDSLSAISFNMFAYCNNLKSISIGSGVTLIDRDAFHSCYSLSSITVNAVIPPVLDVYSEIGSGNPIIYVPCESVSAYKSATNWSAYASRIQGIPPCSQPTQYKFTATYSGGTSYSAECDSSTLLTTATTKPSGYEYSAMTSAVIGDCIESIHSMAFDECYNLSSVTIGSGVTTIYSQAFSNCQSLSSITLPSSVTNIGDYSFLICSNLSSVTVESTTPPILGRDVFDGTPIASGTGVILVPSQSLNLYKSASRWDRFANQIQAIP